MRVLVRRTVVGSSSVVERPCELCLHGLCFSLLPGAYHGLRLEELLAVVALAPDETLQHHPVGKHLALGLPLTVIRLAVGDAVEVRLVGAPLLSFQGLVLETDEELAAAALSPVNAAILLDGTILWGLSLLELRAGRIDEEALGGRN